MAGRTADALLLGDEERAELEALTRSRSVSAGVAQRARIVLLAAEGTPNHQIAEKVGVSRPTVNEWRARYAERGLAGLADEARPGVGAADRSAADRGDHVDATAEAVGGDALVEPAAGAPSWGSVMPRSRRRGGSTG